jgi:hypothetical protein
MFGDQVDSKIDGQTERRKGKEEVATTKGVTFCKVQVGSSATRFSLYFLNVSTERHRSQHHCRSWNVPGRFLFYELSKVSIMGL